MAPEAVGSLIERLMPHPPRPPGKEPATATGPRVHVLRGEALVAVPITTGSSDGQLTRVTGGDLAAGTEVVVGLAGATP